jgi:protein TonB
MNLPVAFVLAAALSSDAPGADLAWRKRLEAPLSPGAVGLLVGHADDAAVVERWRGALDDASPRTRAAAARAANIAGATALLPALMARLEAETDPDAASEALRAVAALGGPAQDLAIDAAARRLGGAVAGTYVTLLCRTRGVELVEKLAGFPEGAWSKAGAVAILTRGDEAALNRAALLALRSTDAETWAAVLELARERRRTLDRGFLASALASAKPGLRAEAVWHVVGEQLQDPVGPITPPMEGALATPLDTTDVETEFALEMLARVRGRKPVDSPGWAEWIAAHDVPGYADVLRRPALLDLLTPAESAALSVRLTGAVDGLANEARETRTVRVPAAPSLDTVPVVEVRTLEPLPDGLLTDLFQVAGCSPPSGRKMLAAEISYDPSGRPRSVRVGASDITGPCLEAGRAALALGFAPAGDRPASAAQAVFLVFDKEWIACCSNSAAAPAKTAPSQIGKAGDIKEPRKTRSIPPVYPENARRARLEGVAVVEAVISPAGCIRSVRHVSGPGLLAVAALQAVSGWAYTPTLLNGDPVPVIMTVTVNFRLN